MQILALVTDAFGGHGGIAKFNRDLLSALCADERVTEVVALPRLLPEKAGVLPAKLNYVTSGLGGKFRYALAVLKSAICNRQSAIILCGHINLLPLAFVACWFCRAPVILVIHGVDAWQPTGSSLANRLVRKVDAFVAVSEFTRQRFLAWAKPERAKNFVLPNCVDLTQFTPGEKSPLLLARYNLRGKTVLLTVARLSAAERYKGVDEVLEVLPSVAKEISNPAYLIVGDGTDRERLRQKAVELGLQQHVVFAGRIPHEELAEHHRLADAFVMAGWGEGFGIVYLEAMACGVPIIASRADASGEIVARVGEGTVVDPKNREELRAAIVQTLKEGKYHIPSKLSEFSQSKFNARLRGILDELLPAASGEKSRAKLADVTAS